MVQRAKRWGRMRHGNGHDQPSYIMAALLLAGKNQSPRTLALPMPLLIAPETVAGPMILAIGNSFCSSSSAVALGPAAIACRAFTALFVGRLSNRSEEHTSELQSLMRL